MISLQNIDGTYIIEIDYHQSEELCRSKLEYFLLNQANGKFSVTYPLGIDHCRFSTDVAFAYLHSSIVADKLCKFADHFDYEIKRNCSNNSVVKIDFQISNQMFIDALLDVMELYDEYNPEGFPEAYAEIEDELNSNNITAAIPDLLDNYYSNLICGGFFDLEEDIEAYLHLHPEWQYRFWRSAISNSLNAKLFASEYCWIVPISFDINHPIFLKYLQLEPISLNKVRFLSLGEEDFIIFDKKMYLSPRVSCELKLAHSILASQCGIVLDDEARPIFRKIDSTNNLMIVNDGYFQYLYFNIEQMSLSDLNKLSSKISRIKIQVDEIRGIPIPDFDWSKITPEIFEDICYDIIYYNPAFDRSSIRKMGKTNSRDGGRDIVVFTKVHNPWDVPKKYIFQCKRIPPNKSLTAKKVTDIVDMLTIYEADGFAVMTPGIIDATLFDKLDDIGVRYNVETKRFNYSRPELEREIASNSSIFKKYFSHCRKS